MLDDVFDMMILICMAISLALYFVAPIYGGLSVLVTGILVIIKAIKKGKITLEESKLVGEKILSPVIDVKPYAEFQVLKPTRVRFKIKNILDTFGIRIRFKSVDYVNPTSLDLVIPPNKSSDEDIIFIPLGAGKREFSISYARLYDKNGHLIPSEIADDLGQQKFQFFAQEAALGLSSRQKSILSSIVKISAFLSASGLIYLSILQLSGASFLIFILTKVVPLLTILQVPVLMLMFYLDRKLPEKPTFIFEGEA